MTTIQQNLGTPVLNWTPRSRPSQARLIGRYCHLELFNLERHGLALFNALQENGEESWTDLPYGPYQTFAEFLASSCNPCS